MFKVIVTSVLIVALCGCTATTMEPSTADAGVAPIGYRAAATQSVKSTFLDPHSIRDAQISQPLYASSVFDGVSLVPRKGWIVCIKANAKNRMGGYTGQQLTVLLFNGETVVDSLSGPDYEYQLIDHCKTAVFTDFDEIEGVS